MYLENPAYIELDESSTETQPKFRAVWIKPVYTDSGDDKWEVKKYAVPEVFSFKDGRAHYLRDRINAGEHFVGFFRATEKYGNQLQTLARTDGSLIPSKLFFEGRHDYVPSTKDKLRPGVSEGSAKNIKVFDRLEKSEETGQWSYLGSEGQRETVKDKETNLAFDSAIDEITASRQKKASAEPTILNRHTVKEPIPLDELYPYSDAGGLLAILQRIYQFLRRVIYSVVASFGLSKTPERTVLFEQIQHAGLGAGNGPENGMDQSPLPGVNKLIVMENTISGEFADGIKSPSIPKSPEMEPLSSLGNSTPTASKEAPDILRGFAPPPFSVRVSPDYPDQQKEINTMDSPHPAQEGMPPDYVPDEVNPADMLSDQEISQMEHDRETQEPPISKPEQSIPPPAKELSEDQAEQPTPDTKDESIHSAPSNGHSEESLQKSPPKADEPASAEKVDPVSADIEPSEAVIDPPLWPELAEMVGALEFVPLEINPLPLLVMGERLLRLSGPVQTMNQNEDTQQLAIEGSSFPLLPPPHGEDESEQIDLEEEPPPPNPDDEPDPEEEVLRLEDYFDNIDLEEADEDYERSANPEIVLSERGAFCSTKEGSITYAVPVISTSISDEAVVRKTQLEELVNQIKAVVEERNTHFSDNPIHPEIEYHSEFAPESVPTEMSKMVLMPGRKGSSIFVYQVERVEDLASVESQERAVYLVDSLKNLSVPLPTVEEKEEESVGMEM